MKTQVTIVDYGRSNLLSVQRALEHCGANVSYARNEKEVLQADVLVLPGVGAFDDGMRLLRENEMAQAICEKAKKGTPLFGICLGLQMLFEHSAEGGQEPGLGLLEGTVAPLPKYTPDGVPVRVPSMGWRALNIQKTASPEWFVQATESTPATPEYYFVHSYHAKPRHKADIAAYYTYGGHEICAAVAKENIFATQFHPEKSGAAGLWLLQKFCDHL